jgi:hypothetical protein
MSFWKLAGAIVVGNILTGLVAALLWVMVLASALSGATSNAGAPAIAPIHDVSSEAQDAYLKCVGKAKTYEEAEANCPKP